LEGFPRKEICDPSNLSVDELIKLFESLKDGKCAFKPLPAADRVVLQAMVDEQESNGANPWGKRKRRSDAGKQKKKRKNSASIMHLSSTGSVPPPSCTSEAHDDMIHDESDDDMSDGGTCPEDKQPRKIIQKRSLKVVAQHSSSMSTPITGPAATPMMGAKTRIGAVHYQSDGSISSPDGSPSHGSVFDDDEPESEEEELGWEGDEPIGDLTRSIEMFGGGPDDDEREEDG
jgi:hypothetical protein